MPPRQPVRPPQPNLQFHRPSPWESFVTSGTALLGGMAKGTAGLLSVPADVAMMPVRAAGAGIRTLRNGGTYRDAMSNAASAAGGFDSTMTINNLVGDSRRKVNAGLGVKPGVINDTSEYLNDQVGQIAGPIIAGAAARSPMREPIPQVEPVPTVSSPPSITPGTSSPALLPTSEPVSPFRRWVNTLDAPGKARIERALNRDRLSRWMYDRAGVNPLDLSASERGYVTQRYYPDPAFKNSEVPYARRPSTMAPRMAPDIDADTIQQLITKLLE